uniref:Uncharacterized protein n=1 Tax=Physcomitrium patens TaxID=3218 RepID=A0A2K1INW2_PHYPA|nr:hypothetical protein PHYPA_027276 [Physcomitrium patens]
MGSPRCQVTSAPSPAQPGPIPSTYAFSIRNGPRHSGYRNHAGTGPSTTPPGPARPGPWGGHGRRRGRAEKRGSLTSHGTAAGVKERGSGSHNRTPKTRPEPEETEATKPGREFHADLKRMATSSHQGRVPDATGSPIAALPFRAPAFVVS